MLTQVYCTTAKSTPKFLSALQYQRRDVNGDCLKIFSYKSSSIFASFLNNKELG